MILMRRKLNLQERCAIVEGTYEQKKLKLPRSGLLEQAPPVLILRTEAGRSTTNKGDEHETNEYIC